MSVAPKSSSSDRTTGITREQLIEKLNEEWDPLESTCRHASLSIL